MADELQQDSQSDTSVELPTDRIREFNKELFEMLDDPTRAEEAAAIINGCIIYEHGEV